MGACLCKTKRRSSPSREADSGIDDPEDMLARVIVGATGAGRVTGRVSSSNRGGGNEGLGGSYAGVRSAGSRIFRSVGLLGSISLSGSYSELAPRFINKIGRHSTDQSSNSRLWSVTNKLSMHADRLVVDTLESIRPTMLNEPSNTMQKLHLISETEIGWLVVISSLINKVDLEHPFGPALILLILEDAPLPTKKSVHRLDEALCLTMHRERSVAKQRNIGIVLGCLAEKLAGTLSSVLFSEKVQEFLLSRIEPGNHPSVVIHSLLALEKFSQTTDNKKILLRKLNATGSTNSLVKLEKLISSSDCLEQQVGFCARWHLDNHFIQDGRALTHETIDRDNLNVMLNAKDASENLKISADGLTARNDTSRFESVRCTYAMAAGIYYYEVQLITPGVMQIGFATKQSKFFNHDGFGIGDDQDSFAYDGCRQLIWHNARSSHTYLPRWKEGDILGCLIDLDKFEIRFSLNGQMGEPSSDLFKTKPLSTQYYAAASFMPFQQCVFNFGRVPFAYPPETYNFRAINQCATLSEEDKIIMPRHLIMGQINVNSFSMNACTICCDNVAVISLKPCGHNGFCVSCADQLDNCPLCRIAITSRKTVD